MTDALPVFFGKKFYLLSFLEVFTANSEVFFFGCLLETKSDSFLYFGEFVEIVCQFCFFEQVDLLRYIFNVLDADKMGTVEKVDEKHLIPLKYNFGIFNKYMVLISILTIFTENI